jgi:hypothetical protein
LFGDLKNGGTLHINVKDGAFDLQTVKSKSKEPETVDQN